MSIFKKVSVFLFLTFILVACSGYKPITNYAKKEIYGNVYVKLIVSLNDPRNSVLVKDTVDKLLIQKLGARLVDDINKADTIMNLGINSINITTLQYNTQGYAQLYNADVNIEVSYKNSRKKFYDTFNVRGDYNFTSENQYSDTITDAKRFEAIKAASSEALDELLSKIAVLNYK